MYTGPDSESRPLLSNGTTHMSSEVLYRRYRSRTFSELVGQEVVVRTLRNAIASDRVAHAYLFAGPRGTGKTSAGRLLAKAVNCDNRTTDPDCTTCASCVSYLDGSALDLIELDAASNRGIDEIRSLREKANFAPSAGTDAYKVYLVDEVHMLTEPAFNALLKTLEEPPAHVIFVLATTETHKVPATVVSRCQRFDFRRIALDDAVARLKFIAGAEGIEVPDDGLRQIARTATGSLRDAINLLEQLVDSYGEKLTDDQVREGLGLVTDARSGELAAHALRGDLAAGLAVISSVRDDGMDLRQFQRQVVAQMRGLLLTKAGAPPSESWSEEQIGAMEKVVADVDAGRIVRTLRTFGEADLRADPLSPLPLELALASSILAAEAQAQPPAAVPVQSRPRPAPPKTQPAKTPPPAKSAPAAKKPAPDSPPKSQPVAEQAKPAAAKGKPAGPNAMAAAKNAGRQVEPQVSQPEPVADDAAPAPVIGNGAAPAPLPASAGLEDVRDRWQDIYEKTREFEFRAGALLNSGCGIIDSSEDEVVFGFRHAMLLDRMEGDGGENIRALQQAVDEVLGPGRAVRCVLDPNVDVQRPERRSRGLVDTAEELVGEALTSDDAGQPGGDRADDSAGSSDGG